MATIARRWWRKALALARRVVKPSPGRKDAIVTPAPSTYEWDVFISHASEDKGTLVQPLAELLRVFGVRVWYDEFTLTIGDSLSRAIDRGLSRSAFGVIVLSPSFIAKRWPEYELRGLVAKEMAGKKTILPIWHGLTREDVLQFSPTLADAMALVSEGRSLADIAFELITVIRPDLTDRFAAHTHSRQLVKDGVITYRPTAELKHGPVRHQHFSDALVGRVRLIRAALIGVRPQTLSYWIDGFKRDANPEVEVGLWERAAASFLEYSAVTPLTQEQAPIALGVILGIQMGLKEEELARSIAQLPPKNRHYLFLGTQTASPAYEFKGIPMSLDEDADIDPEALELLRCAEAWRYKGGSRLNVEQI